MTVLDAAPLNCARSAARDKWTGNFIIGFSIFSCLLFIFCLWVEEVDWYYMCLFPALLPTAVAAAYWVWLTSQYFRYA